MKGSILMVAVGALAWAPGAMAQQLVDEAPTPEVGAVPQPGLSPSAATPPDYPAGSDYEAAVATLGLDAQTRCSAHREGGMYIALGVTGAAAVAAQAACDIIPEMVPPGVPNPAKPAACSVLAVVNATAAAAEIASLQCEFQDGAVDSAEIEAAYENTKALVGATNTLDARTAGIDVRTHRMDVRDHLRDERDLERHLSACRPLVSLVLPAAHGGMLEVVGALVEHRIGQAVAAGAQDRHIADAVSLHADGVALAGAGRYDVAFTRFCSAYHEFGQTHYNR